MVGGELRVNRHKPCFWLTSQTGSAAATAATTTTPPAATHHRHRRYHHRDRRGQYATLSTEGGWAALRPTADGEEARRQAGGR